MSDAHQTPAHELLRRRILSDLLKNVTLQEKDLPEGLVSHLVVGSLAESLGGNEEFQDADLDSESLAGGLKCNDIRRWHVPLHTLDNKTRGYLRDEMNALALSLLSYFDGNSSQSEERLEQAWELPYALDALLKSQSDTIHSATEIRIRIERLTQLLAELHPRLETKLTEALTTLAPLVMAKRSASIALLVTMIESGLLKLSLLRARARRDIYHAPVAVPSAAAKRHGEKSSTSLTMAQALGSAHQALESEHAKLSEENDEARAKLKEYDRLIALVDGDGGYRQIIEDWGRVQSDIEECRKDLRRLGWTDD